MKNTSVSGQGQLKQKYLKFQLQLEKKVKSETFRIFSNRIWQS